MESIYPMWCVRACVTPLISLQIEMVCNVDEKKIAHNPNKWKKEISFTSSVNTDLWILQELPTK